MIIKSSILQPSSLSLQSTNISNNIELVVVVVLLLNVNGKQLWSCRVGQLT